jgi:hypothetical protein
MITKAFTTTAMAAILALTSACLSAADPQIKVYKTVTCGCCGKWVDHLKANGFEPVVENVQNLSEYRRQFGVPENLQSCHTATVGGYTVEGHVPAADIKRMLKEKPKAKGLAVPGMPLGSPGMEAPRSQPYAVLLFQNGGQTSVFQKYPGD